VVKNSKIVEESAYTVYPYTYVTFIW